MMTKLRSTPKLLPTYTVEEYTITTSTIRLAGVFKVLIVSRIRNF